MLELQAVIDAMCNVRVTHVGLHMKRNMSRRTYVERFPKPIEAEWLDVILYVGRAPTRVGPVGVHSWLEGEARVLMWYMAFSGEQKRNTGAGAPAASRL